MSADTKEVEDLINARRFENEYLTFTLNNDIYAVDILRVQEIQGWISMTRIPNTSPDIGGVINIRGTIIPIVDLRKKFELPEISYNAMNVIIVLRVQEEKRDRISGIIVDGVKDVITVDQHEIRTPPAINNQCGGEYIVGLTSLDDTMVSHLDVDKLLSLQESLQQAI